MNPILKIAGILPILTACSNIQGEWYSSNLDTSEYELYLEYDTSYFEYYDDMPRDILIDADVTDLEGSLEFYEMFLADENDSDVIEQIVAWIRSTTQNRKEQIQLAVSLIQNEIIYDYEKLKNEGNWRVYYPMETLIWKKGVCSDKSLLLGKILVYMDYKICFFLFDENNHMALGIKTKTDGFAGSGFEYIETTNPFEIGKVPSASPGQILSLMDESPKIIVPIFNGTNAFDEFQSLQKEYERQNIAYGLGYSTATVQIKKKLIDLAYLKETIFSLEGAYNELISDYNNGIVGADSVISMESTLNRRIDEYNALLETIHEK